MKKEIINVKDISISLFTKDYQNDYISLTDIARYKSDVPSDVIKNWLRNKDTLQFLSVWEQLNNPNFNSVEFDRIKSEAGFNAFTMSPKKWIDLTDSIGIVSQQGRYANTYAHSDIAFEFASWISSEFKLYIIKEYQRLKLDENSKLNLDWNLNREISKLNYKIHTDAVKEYIIPKIDTVRRKYAYANEADILNLALFGKTAKEWRIENPDLKGNIRDYATIEQLLILSNLESYNSILIQQEINSEIRLQMLNDIAVDQQEKLTKNDILSLKKIKELKE